MNKKYGLLNEAKDKIIKEVTIIEGKTSWLGNISNPSHEQWLEAGWLLFVEPKISEYQANSFVNVLDVKNGTYTTRIDSLSVEEIEASKVQAVTEAVEMHLNAKAQECRYDNIHTACAYAAAANPFQAESLKFVSWRGNIWAYCYQVLEDVKAGDRTEPTPEELVAELPAFNG